MTQYHATWKIVGESIEKLHGRQLVPGIHFLQRPITPQPSGFSLPLISNIHDVKTDHLVFVQYTTYFSTSATLLSYSLLPSMPSHSPLLTRTHILWPQTSSYPWRNNSKVPCLWNSSPQLHNGRFIIIYHRSIIFLPMTFFTLWGISWSIQQVGLIIEWKDLNLTQYYIPIFLSNVSHVIGTEWISMNG